VPVLLRAISRPLVEDGAKISPPRHAGTGAEQNAPVLVATNRLQLWVNKLSLVVIASLSRDAASFIHFEIENDGDHLVV
jgi:hypothetical protein